jgi:hypothetical protein
VTDSTSAASRWLSRNLSEVIVAIAQAQATLAGQSLDVASQPVSQGGPDVE